MQDRQVVYTTLRAPKVLHLSSHMLLSKLTSSRTQTTCSANRMQDLFYMSRFGKIFYLRIDKSKFRKCLRGHLKVCEWIMSCSFREQCAMTIGVLYLTNPSHLYVPVVGRRLDGGGSGYFETYFHILYAISTTRYLL